MSRALLISSGLLVLLFSMSAMAAGYPQCQSLQHIDYCQRLGPFNTHHVHFSSDSDARSQQLSESNAGLWDFMQQKRVAESSVVVRTPEETEQELKHRILDHSCPLLYKKWLEEEGLDAQHSNSVAASTDATEDTAPDPVSSALQAQRVQGDQSIL